MLLLVLEPHPAQAPEVCSWLGNPTTQIKFPLGCDFIDKISATFYLASYCILNLDLPLKSSFFWHTARVECTIVVFVNETVDPVSNLEV